ncbi:MAG TPA: PIN domain-containing protein [Anaeromyxobacteraceae bacterium]|nr:PIN domain-containing protein [Anaeromyxobacteraceae bacterium]
MSALVIDTSAWIPYLAGSGDDAVSEALDEGRVYLSPVVAAELLSGRLTARERRQLEAGLEDLPMCAADRAHWFRVGALRASLQAKGLTVSTPDAHVTQCALDLGAELLSYDGIFVRVARYLPLKLAGGAGSGR